MAMERRAASLGGTRIGDRKTVRRRLDLGGEVGVLDILGHAHPDDVDDFAAIGRDALVEKGDVGTFRPVEPADMLVFHLCDRDCGGRLALQSRIDISHGDLPKS
jgi:hypothetical protein